jgi:hypothetical protein
MNLKTKWVENDGDLSGLQLSQAEGWGTILDVELRSGLIETEMPAWIYEFKVSGSEADVLRYRTNVSVERLAMSSIMPLAEVVKMMIEACAVDMDAHTKAEIVAAYFDELKKNESLCVSMLTQLESAA